MPPIPESKKSTGLVSIELFEQIVKRGPGRRRCIQIVVLPCRWKTVLWIQGKPVAEIRPLLVRLRHGVCFGTVSPRAGKEKTAGTTGTDILAALGTAKRTANYFISYR